MQSRKSVLWLLFLFSSNFAYTFTQSVIFDVQNAFQVAQNTPFSATITIDVIGNTVNVTIPSLVVTLAAEHSDIIPPQVYPFSPIAPDDFTLGYAKEGFLYTKSGVIPQQYRPASPTGVQVTVPSTPSPIFTDLCAVVTVEGNIRLAAQGGGAFGGPGYFPILANGTFTTESVTISYPLAATPLASPSNFSISEGYSQTIYWPTLALVSQCLDGNFSDTYSGGIASYWLDNSTSTSFPYTGNGLIRMGTVTTDASGLPIVSLQDPITVITPPSGYDCTQGSISINPANPQNIVMNSLLINGPLTGTPLLELWRAVSMDGGSTWPTVGQIDTGSIPPTGGDNNGLFDRFGNYWITTLATTSGVNYLTILVSYDGGVSFQIAAQFNATAPPFSGAANSFFDFSQLAFGGDGNGGWALYFVCDFVNTSSSVQIPCVGYIPVTGLGAIGSASLVAMNALAGVAKIPASIIVSDAGELFMNFNSALDNQHSTYSYYYLFYKTGGISGLVDGSLIGPNFWASINIGFGVGAYPGIGTNYSGINAKNIRGQQPMIPVRGLAYDNNKSILYALVYNHDPIYSQNSSLYLVASNDSGSSWSVPYYIKDNPLGNCFSASMTVDQITGNLFITWYDSRSDQPGNQYTQFYGTVVSSAQLDALIDTL